MTKHNCEYCHAPKDDVITVTVCGRCLDLHGAQVDAVKAKLAGPIDWSIGSDLFDKYGRRVAKITKTKIESRTVDVTTFADTHTNLVRLSDLVHIEAVGEYR